MVVAVVEGAALSKDTKVTGVLRRAVAGFGSVAVGLTTSQVLIKQLLTAYSVGKDIHRMNDNTISTCFLSKGDLL